MPGTIWDDEFWGGPETATLPAQQARSVWDDSLWGGPEAATLPQPQQQQPPVDIPDPVVPPLDMAGPSTPALPPGFTPYPTPEFVPPTFDAQALEQGFASRPKSKTPKQLREEYDLTVNFDSPAENPGERMQQALQFAREDTAAEDLRRRQDEAGVTGFVAGKMPRKIVKHGIPFLSSLIEADQLASVYGAARRIEAGQGSNSDIDVVATWIARSEAAANDGFADKVSDVLGAMPGFMGELMFTGGTFSGTKGAAEAGAKKALTKVAGKYAEGTAARLAAQGAGALAGTAAIAAANPQMVAKSTFERMLPEQENIRFNVDANGKPTTIDLGPMKTFVEAIPAGYLDSMIEIGTEYAGGELSKGASKFLGKIPVPQRVRALAGGIANRWMKATGHGPADFVERLKDVGWNGIIGEALEERAGDVLRMATGLQSPYDNPTGQLLVAAPYEAVAGDPQKALELQKQAAAQLAVEGAAFGATGGTFGALGYAADKAAGIGGLAKSQQSRLQQPPQFDADYAEQWAHANPDAAAAMVAEIGPGQPVSRGYLRQKKFDIPSSNRSTQQQRNEFVERVRQVVQQSQGEPGPSPQEAQQEIDFIKAGAQEIKDHGTGAVIQHKRFLTPEESERIRYLKHIVDNYVPPPTTAPPSPQEAQQEIVKDDGEISFTKPSTTPKEVIQSNEGQGQTQVPQEGQGRQEVLTPPAVETEAEPPATSPEAPTAASSRQTPFALFGHDRTAAEEAGWKFEAAKKGYNGNPPRQYAISPEGDRFVWNQSMRHGGADPWDFVGRDTGEETEGEPPPPTVPAAPPKKKLGKQYKPLGQNIHGQNVFEDDKGVRYYDEGNVRHVEKVMVTPTRAGVVTGVDTTRRGNEFKTASEVQADEIDYMKRNHGVDVKIVEPAPEDTDLHDAADFLKQMGANRVVFFDPGERQVAGFTNTSSGTVYINVRAKGDALPHAIGDEATHVSGLDKKSEVLDDTTDPDGKILAKYTTQRRAKASPAYQKVLDAKPDLMRREAIAEMFGDFYRDKAFRDSLRSKNPTLFERIREILLKVLGKWEPRNELQKRALAEFRREMNERGEKKINPQASESKPATSSKPSPPATTLDVNTDWDALEKGILKSFGGDEEPATEPTSSPQSEPTKPAKKLNRKLPVGEQYGLPGMEQDAAEKAARDRFVSAATKKLTNVEGVSSEGDAAWTEAHRPILLEIRKIATKAAEDTWADQDKGDEFEYGPWEARDRADERITRYLRDTGDKLYPPYPEEIAGGKFEDDYSAHRVEVFQDVARQVIDERWAELQAGKARADARKARPKRLNPSTEQQSPAPPQQSAADAEAAKLAKLFDDLQSQGIALSETGENEEDVAAGQAWREQKTRSLWFKGWFGDWEAAASREPIPYSVAPATPISGRKEAIKIGIGLRGEYSNLDTGLAVRLFRDGVQDTVFRHQQDYRAVRAIPDLIRNARRLAIEPYRGKLPGGKWVHVFYAPLRIGSESHLAKLTVIERASQDAQLEEFRLYNLTSRKNNRLARKRAAAESEDPRVSQAGEPIATISIGDLIDAVKEHDPQHVPSAVVNADGTPKQVFHGTISGSNRLDRIAFFTADYNYAGGRAMYKGGGANVKPVYLAFRNPLYATLDHNKFSVPKHEIQLIERAVSLGHDSLIIDAVPSVAMKFFQAILGRSNVRLVDSQGQQQRYYVSLYDGQAKSATGNRGTFGPSDDITLSESEPDATPARPRNPQLEAAAAKMVVMYLKEGVRDWSTVIGRVTPIVGSRLTALEPYLRHAWDYVRGQAPGAKMDSSRPLAGTSGTSNETEVQVPATDRLGDQPGEGGRASDLGEKPTGLPSESESGSTTGSDNGRGDELAGDEGAANRPGGASQGGGQRGSSRVGSSTRPADDGGRGSAPGGNFKLTDDVQVGGERGFGKKSRYRDNIAAIRLLKQLESESRRETTLDEQKTLAKYVGWGGIKEAFKKKVSPEWAQQQAELKSLLTPEEYAAAKRSIQNAHYTDPAVIRAIWDGLASVGFEGGRISEPAIGSGLFFSLMPEGVRQHANTRLSGVELDSITGRIARRLFPNADIKIAGYQEVDVPDNSVDLHISNVPFASVTVYDRHDPDLKHGAFIHDFYFEKAIKKTRPGGLVVFITADGTLDKLDSSVRKRLAQLGGDLVGAIRLPGGAFRRIADTSVVTDVLVFQKRMPGAEPGGEAFKSVGKLKQTGYWGFPEDSRTKTRYEGETEFSVNEYFVNHPTHIIGEPAWTGTMNNQKGSFNVEPGSVDVGKRIRDIFQEIGEKLNRETLADGGTSEHFLPQHEQADDDWPEDWLRVEGERVFVRKNGKKTEVPAPYLKHEKDKDGKVTKVVTSKAAADRYQALIGVFEAAEKLIAMQPDPRAADEEVDRARADLNRVYDAFVKKYGPLSAERNRTFADASLSVVSRLLSIENYDPDENTATKTEIFSRRTERPHIAPTHADNPEQALRMSLMYRGGIDVPYMEQVTGLEEKAIVSALGDRVYRSPDTEHWQTAEQYLSGNVREKLREAQAAAERDDQYKRNVEALEKNQPDDIPVSKIGVRLGSTWIPDQDYRDFYEQNFGRDLPIRRVVSDNTWLVDFSGARPTEKETLDFGTEDLPAYELLEKYLNNREIKVRRTARDGATYVDREKTANAAARLESLKNLFLEWLWSDGNRSDRLHRFYNDNFNNLRDAKWDGSHLEFPGMSVDWRERLNPHQVNAVWRYLQTGNMLLAHLAGAGKTVVMAAMAMEAKRLSGNPNYKTLITAPNHLVTSGQFQKELLEAYPSAKILAATPGMLSGKGRRAFLKRIAAENYDIIVMAHSSFSRIPLDPDFERDFIQRKIDELEAEVRVANAEKDKNYEAALEAQLDRLREKLARLNDQVHRDENSVTFDKLGVDALFIDEAHLYKNLQVRTRLSRVPGVSTRFSARAFDMLMKTRYFNERSNYRGVVLATGTPIANAVGELYVMQQYLQPQVLDQLRIGAFDAWVANFADIVMRPEMDPAGGGMRMHARMSAYRNVPELMSMFRQVADVKLLTELKDILARPTIIGGKPQRIEVERNPYLESYVEQLQLRAARVRAGAVDKSEDNMLRILGHGRLASLDMRLVDPTTPDMEGSKVNTAVDNVHRIWKETADRKLTQIIWLDAVAPDSKKVGRVNIYREIVDKLVAKGTPRSEIAIIHDYDEKTRPKLFSDINTGRVRVLLASTDTGGTGLNVHKLLIANHHLNPPFRPDQVEQRDGRILRRGNTNTQVHVFQYVGKGSFDAFFWDMLERKASFINQALSGGRERSVEEDDGELTAAEMKAAAADDPHMMEYVQVNARVNQLRVEQSAWIEEQQSIRRQITQLTSSIPYWQEQAEIGDKTRDEYNRLARKLGYDVAVSDVYSDKQSPEVRAGVDGNKYTTKKEYGEVLLSRIDKAKADLNAEWNALDEDEKKRRGWDRHTTKFDTELNGWKGQVSVERTSYGSFYVKSSLQHPAGASVLVDLGESESGNVTRILNQIEHELSLGDRARNKIRNEIEPKIAGLKKHAGKSFPKTKELEELSLRRQELFNLTQRDDELERDVINLLSSRAKRSVEITEQGTYVYTDNGEAVPELPVEDATLQAKEWQTQRRLIALEELKKNVRVYDWVRPPAATVNRKGLKRKSAAQSAQEKADEGGEFVTDPGFFGGAERKLRAKAIHPSIRVDSPEVEQRLQQAHGFDGPGLRERLKESAVKAWHVATRVREHLPNIRQFDGAREVLRLMDVARDAASDEASRTIAAILDPLDADTRKIFERKIIVDNLRASVERGQPLRFGFANLDQIKDYQEKVGRVVALNPSVQEAIAERNRVVDELVDKLVEHKLLDESAKENAKTYFHQQVLSYVAASRIGGTNKPQRQKRGFQKRRIIGPPELEQHYDYNTSYVEAEAEWMTDALSAIRKEELLKQLSDQYNQADKLKEQAKQRNFENVVGGPEVARRIEQIRGELAESRASEDSGDSAERARRKALIEEMEDINPLYPYDRQIARMFGWLRKQVQEGDAPLGPFTEDQILGNQEGEPWYDLDEEEPGSKWMAYLNFLAKGDYDKATAAALAAFKAMANRESFIRDTLGDKYATMESLAIADPNLELWQPEPGNVFYRGFTLPEKVVEEALRSLGDMFPLEKSAIHEALIMGGPRERMALPAALVEQLDSMQKPQPSGWILDSVRSLMGMWKQFMLLAPRRVGQYMMRNLTGDLDPVIAARLPALKKTDRAINELWNYFYGKKLALSPELRSARDLGVISSSLTAAEVPDLKTLPVFRRLYEYNTPVTQLPLEALSHVKRFNEFRESMLRYAAYLDYLESLKAGPLTDFGASNPDTVKILQKTMGDEVAAAHLARNLLGDYGNITVAGQAIRSYLIPFYSWTEVNAKRWPMLAINVVKQSKLKGKGNYAKAGLLLGVGLTRLVAMTVLKDLFNHWFFGDDEDKLGPNERANPHVLLGHRPDGTIRILRNTGALGDFLEWFGVQSLVSLWPQFEAGQISAADLIDEMAKDPVNKIVQGVGPHLKFIPEVLMGQSLFPDVFNPRPQERDEAIANMAGLRDEYRAAKGWLTKSGDRARPNYWEGYLVGTVDPKREILSEVLSLREKFLAKKGKPSVNVLRTSDFSPLREAAYGGNYEAFQEARQRYVEKGKTIKNFMESVSYLDPIHARLNDADEKEFVDKFLNGVQRKKLVMARDYADQTRATLLTWWVKDVTENGTAEEKKQLAEWERTKLESASKSLRRIPKLGPHYQERRRQALADREQARRDITEIRGLRRQSIGGGDSGSP